MTIKETNPFENFCTQINNVAQYFAEENQKF